MDLDQLKFMCRLLLCASWQAYHLAIANDKSTPIPKVGDWVFEVSSMSRAFTDDPNINPLDYIGRLMESESEFTLIETLDGRRITWDNSDFQVIQIPSYLYSRIYGTLLDLHDGPAPFPSPLTLPAREASGSNTS